MVDYTKNELEDAFNSISSTLRKCEKAFGKLNQGTSQYTLMKRRIEAFRIALELIEDKLAGYAK
ncbi:MAG: hypothetical protein FWC72_04575 [Oscillospiraceae bacterium]|nr:hypothetical protein [Oscillospiraceae bacterium]